MTTAGVSYITASTLYEKLTSSTADQVVVVDVRDEDRKGGHIRQSQHIPSAIFMSNPSSYVTRFKTKSVIVFHCMYSQQRGPRAARAFATALPLILSAADNHPTVHILEGGFENFIRTVGKDSSLLDQVDKDLYGYID